MSMHGTEPLDSDNLYVDDRHAFRTVTGRKVNLMHFTPDDVDITDIAVALSNTCRYGGHVKRFLSVAEHSVQVSEFVWHTRAEPVLAMAGLLHDAHEAYLGDVIKPIKSHPELAVLYSWATRLDWCIGQALGVDPDLFHAPIVRDADVQSFLAEKDERAGRWTPTEAAGIFLDRWQWLCSQAGR